MDGDPSFQKRKKEEGEEKKNIELIEMNSRANAHTQKAQRKTISPQDVFAALQDDLEFPDFVPRLEAELAKFNEISTEKRNTYRKKVAADKAADKSGAAGDAEAEADEATEETRRDSNGQPAAKKARRESGHVDEVGDTHEKEIEEPEADEEEVEDEEEEEEEDALAALDRQVEEEELARADEMDGNDDEEDDSESD
ncbi:hypothetical protein BP5796_00316 [Coleophoma crateriformis]|uniref:Transcription factor CBF/NF-Y/archaeal histone domain-containing protein n=1 Tax=Coleophoma crateriformis TaxID=565419 RepID=A0A3D8T7K2_9HELO|nr:hypothetical protein BP5796_00316 [Coleophoma crateriformis]